MRKVLMCGAILVSAIFLSSTGLFAGDLSFSWGSGQSSESSPSEVKVKKNGPPSHAPAHGYRIKRQYQYYPSSSVYHDADRGLYFYLSGSNWRISASLPADLRMHLGTSVSIEMDTDKPYVYNAEHRKQYPPGQMKKMEKSKKGKWAKK